MRIVNGRLIINENELDDAAKELQRKVNRVLKEIGFNKKCQVRYEFECYNSETHHMWHELWITSGDFSIDLTTDGFYPTLVKNDDEFEFYHVFNYSGSCITNPKTWKNAGITPLDDGDECVENIVLNRLGIY